MRDKERNLIFIHINRCAGTSIERFFGWKGDHKTVLDHVKDLGWKNFESHYSFAFVRNPWDKMLSMYQHNLDGGANARRSQAVNDFEFNTWLVKLTELDLWNKLRYTNQVNWLRYRGKTRVDFVGRFERLATDWRRLLKEIDMPYSPLGNHNSSKRGKGYRRHYSDLGRQVVATYFAKDIKEFDYEF